MYDVAVCSQGVVRSESPQTETDGELQGTVRTTETDVTPEKAACGRPAGVRMYNHYNVCFPGHSQDPTELSDAV